MSPRRTPGLVSHPLAPGFSVGPLLVRLAERRWALDVNDVPLVFTETELLLGPRSPSFARKSIERLTVWPPLVSRAAWDSALSDLLAASRARGLA